MYKALITDLDGTAVPISDDGSSITESTIQAVQSAHEVGKIVACATGRSWWSTKPIVQKLGITAPCVIQGGTRIIDPTTEETLWEKALDHGVPAKVLDVFKAETTIGRVYMSDGISREIDDVTDMPESTQFVYILAVTEGSAIKIADTIKDTGYAAVHYTPSWDGNGLVDIHVTHLEATKEHAIQAWQAMQGISHEETIGMGDSGNDLPIFMAAGLKVAVANGTDNLKQLADYIAPSVEDNALEHVISKYLLSSL